jgi:hypothetical protein
MACSTPQNHGTWSWIHEYFHPCLVIWNHGIIYFSVQLGISSSQLLLSHIFQRSRYTTNYHQLDPTLHDFLRKKPGSAWSTWSWSWSTAPGRPWQEFCGSWRTSLHEVASKLTDIWRLGDVKNQGWLVGLKIFWGYGIEFDQFQRKIHGRIYT